MEESSKQYWHQKDDLLGEEEELMTMMGGELLDERTVYAPADYSNNKHHQGGEDAEEEEPRRRQESMVNRLISTVYSGPTISDIESALSFTGGGDHQQQLKYISTSSPAVFSPEKVMENKYTLKMKTCGNGLAEDGYKWRKYGQKCIKNSPNPRSYYRCTNPRCNAKKQVERATDEADTLVVTYEGLHLHYTYSHFLHEAQAQQQQGFPKKPKRANTCHDDEVRLSPSSLAPLAAGDVLAVAAAAWGYSDGGDEEQQQEEEDMVAISNGGLLEDVVPLLVRRPCGSTTTTTTTPGSPPSNNNSSVSWTPYIDMAILSNIFF